MQTDDVFHALDGALNRWEQKPATTDPQIEASLRHIEVFALAACARELREISRTLQARHEAEIERGTTDPSRVRNGPERGLWAPTDVHGGGELEDAGAEPRRLDEPCEARRYAMSATNGEDEVHRCTRPQGHAGEHVDATGARWGGEA